MAGPWEKYSAKPSTGVFTLPPDPAKVAEQQRQARADARAQAEFEQHTREFNATHDKTGAPIAADGALTPEAIAFNAQQYLSTGQMPTLGMGKQAAADREAILNMAAKLAGANGMKGEDLARQIAHYKAGSKQLANLETQLGTIRSNEQAAMQNGKLFLDLSTQAPGRTRVPIANTVIQGVARETGNPAVKGMDSAWQTFTTEYAKVIAGSPNGSGTLSDSARQEAQAMIRSNAAPAQKEAALAAMQKDMDNRIAAIHNSINEGYRNLTQKPGYAVPDSTDTLPLSAVDQQKRQQNKDAAIINGLGANGNGGGGSSPPLMPSGAGTKSLPIPSAMEAAHAQYLAQHWGHIDPNDYANFRAQLDKQYGFAPRIDAYKAIVPDLNARAAQGGSPQGLDIPPVDAKANALDKFNATVFNNRAGAALLGAGSLGGGADELAAALKMPFNGLSFNENLARTNGIRQAAADQYPVSTTLGTIGGQMGLALTGASLAPKIAELAVAHPLIGGAIYGGITGALQNNDNRIGGAALGAVEGAGGAALGNYVAAPIAKAVMDTKGGQAVSRGGRFLYNRMFGNRFGAPVADQAIVPAFTSGEKSLPDSVTLMNAQQNLTDAANFGLPYSLADADPKLRMLAGSVARKSPDARQLAENTFDPRALGQADRAVQAIDTNLAPITDVGQRGSDLLAAGDQAAGPSYNLAFQRPGPVDPQLDAMLRTPAGRASLANARTIAANKGLDPNKMGFDLDNEGNVVLKSVPSYETLQLVKRGMDAHLNSFADQFGNVNLRGNPMAQSVLDLKNRFNARLGDINPNYAEGNDIWSGFAQRKNALDQGYNVLPNNAVPFSQFQRGVSGLNDITLPEAQMGYATNMADTVNKARLSTNPYNTVYGSPLQQQKVATLFPQGADNFDRIYNLENDMAKTRAETLGGSSTAPRLAADQIFDSPAMTAFDTGVQLHTGGTVSPRIAYALGRKALDSYRLGLGQKKADALAPILFNTDPASVSSYVDDLAARKAADALRASDFQRRFGMFGAIAGPSLQGP